MGVYGRVVPGGQSLAGIPVDLSKAARQRLKWFDHYQKRGRRARLTCRYFGISPQTFYRWRRRYNPRDLTTLEDRSRRPKQVRLPTWGPELVEAVLRLRGTYPCWGKDKLVGLLRGEGHLTSTSTVGRVLGDLKKRGLLREPLRFVSARKRPRLRPYGVRKPKGYVTREPGDLVQMDTLELRPLPGVVLEHFTARDVVSRWDVLEVHRQATAKLAAGFLDALQDRMPFPVRAIQVDGGSEFQAEFEGECQRRGISLFVLPPRSPKLNGHVERAQPTHTEEFYQVVDSDFTVAALQGPLLDWERTYNTVRPHQALGYLTPAQWLENHLKTKDETERPKTNRLVPALQNPVYHAQSRKEAECH